MDKLTSPAEAWLSAFARELWPLSSDERDAIVAELRGHLVTRAESGRIDEALTALGSPKALAAAYDPAGGHGAGIASLPEDACGSKGVVQLLRDSGATVRAARNGLPLVGALLFTVLTSTDFLLWTAVRMPAVGIASALVMTVRIFALLIAFSAAYRLMLSRTEQPWAMDRGFFAFSAAMLVAAFLAGIAAVAVGRGAHLLSGAGTASAGIGRGFALLTVALASAALLLLQPWLAGLAARREIKLAATWRRTRGKLGTIVGAWAALVLPLYLLHALLNLLALRVLPFGPASLALAAADALVSAGMVLGAVALNSALFRWVVGEAIPPPSPFSTQMPSPELVDAARLRLRHLVDSQP